MLKKLLMIQNMNHNLMQHRRFQRHREALRLEQLMPLVVTQTLIGCEDLVMSAWDDVPLDTRWGRARAANTNAEPGAGTTGRFSTHGIRTKSLYENLPTQPIHSCTFYLDSKTVLLN